MGAAPGRRPHCAPSPQSTRSGGSPGAVMAARGAWRCFSVGRGARCATTPGTRWRQACCATRWAAGSPWRGRPSTTRCPPRCSTCARAGSPRWRTAAGPTTSRRLAISPARPAWSATVRDPRRCRVGSLLVTAPAGGLQPLPSPPAGSQGLQTPAPTVTVTPSSITVLSTEEGSVAGDTQSLLHMPLFIPCLVLAALLLLTLLAFTTALLRLRKRSALTVCPPGPVLVTNSTQGPDVPSGTCKNYREMPPSLPKEPAPSPVTLPAAKGSDSSDSDYEHYDFSSKPPVALSTFYNSLRRRPGEQQPGEQLHPLVPNQDGMEPFPAEVPATMLCSPPWGRANSLSSSSSSSSSMEPYCNESAPPLHAWPCPQPPAYSPPQQAAPTAPGCTLQPCTVPPAMPCLPDPALAQPQVQVPPAATDPADSSSTSSGEWYENVQGTEPPGYPTPHHGWPAPSCPPAQDPNSSESSDYDDIQSSGC
uniref:Uncharacterized protein n=1 Tax=Anser brachyrhynchus TaxID=132585 RepID=A0A8B9CWF2_9AVES